MMAGTLITSITCYQYTSDHSWYLDPESHSNTFGLFSGTPCELGRPCTDIDWDERKRRSQTLHSKCAASALPPARIFNIEAQFCLEEMLDCQKFLCGIEGLHHAIH